MWMNGFQAIELCRFSLVIDLSQLVPYVFNRKHLLVTNVVHYSVSTTSEEFNRSMLPCMSAFQNHARHAYLETSFSYRVRPTSRWSRVSHVPPTPERSQIHFHRFHVFFKLRKKPSLHQHCHSTASHTPMRLFLNAWQPLTRDCVCPTLVDAGWLKSRTAKKGKRRWSKCKIDFDGMSVTILVSMILESTLM